VAEGEWLAIVGPSGSGKSTLLNILGLLDRPDDGTYVLDGKDTSGLRDRERTTLRNRTIGFVFQRFNLLPRTSALENVAAPLLYRHVRGAERRRRAREALERVGLGDRIDHDPTELSGGQLQRVAVARALVGDPALLLVDEATGNLDAASTAEIIRLLDGLHADGRTIVMITHEADVAAHADRQLLLHDGSLEPIPASAGAAS
jgi:putative ABC transport system ATP-binding protein